MITVDIFFPNHSFGLLNDAQVIAKNAKTLFGENINFRFVKIPIRDFETQKPGVNLSEIIQEPGDLAILVERIICDDFLFRYKEKILLINPEWFRKHEIEQSSKYIDTILFKSKSDFGRLKKVIKINCEYLGFTSTDPNRRVSSYKEFGHYRGKNPARITQPLIDIWLKHPEWPNLSVQSFGYGAEIGIPEWVYHKNLRMFYGMRNFNEHLDDASRTGVHICTTHSEGFGHFINEAKAMSAFVITMDAPPMNELVDESIGILIPIKERKKQYAGFWYEVDRNEIEKAMLKCLSLPISTREKMGQLARESFVSDRNRFLENLKEFFEKRL